MESTRRPKWPKWAAKCARPTTCPTMTSTRIFTADDGSVLIGHFDDNGNTWAEEVKDMDAVDITDEPDCVACLRELKDNDLIAVSNCGHFMCLECSDQWEQAATEEAQTCPLCRASIETRTISVARKFARGAGSAEDPIKIN